MSYPLYSLAELIDGDIPDNAIKDRIVLIGSTAPSLRDLFNVPHTRFRREQEVFQVSGVEIHANRVATLLDHRNNKLAIGWIMPGWATSCWLRSAWHWACCLGKGCQPSAAV